MSRFEPVKLRPQFDVPAIELLNTACILEPFLKELNVIKCTQPPQQLQPWLQQQPIQLQLRQL